MTQDQAFAVVGLVGLALAVGLTKLIMWVSDLARERDRLEAAKTEEWLNERDDWLPGGPRRKA